MADISLEGKSWTPVGYYDAGINYYYAGTFEGNGHTISNLTIISEDTDFGGLFGYVGENGAVKNLTLSDVEISGSWYIGGIAGVNEGTIENCRVVSGTVEGTKHVGGIAGYNLEGKIENCSVSGTVGDTNSTGGIAGGNIGGTIENCSVSGTVKGSEPYVGGIVSYNSGTIKNCSVSGTVEGSEYYVGGIAGYNVQGTITACYNTGNVEGTDDVGGIVGHNNNQATVKACYSTGSISGNDSSTYIGGIAGAMYNPNSIIDTCYWSVPEGSSADYGIGNEPGSTATTKVDGTNVKWNMAKSAMNTALSSYGYEYKENNDPMTKEMMPLIIVKAESSN